MTVEFYPGINRRKSVKRNLSILDFVTDPQLGGIHIALKSLFAVLIISYSYDSLDLSPWDMTRLVHADSVSSSSITGSEM